MDGKPRAPGLYVLLAGLVWLAAVGLGFGSVVAYSYTPGPAGSPIPSWPRSSALGGQAARPALLFFAHPRCPCTRASLGELAKLVARAPGRARVAVAFYRPAGTTPEWSRGDLWDAAARIPGVELLDDVEGREAARFGLVTSGHVVVYDAAGALRYSGGITAARGHHGDNPQADAVLAVLRAGPDGSSAGPVFGCPIRGDTACPPPGRS